ncbi:MAG: carboxypeptidase-like regulatory domain-containing protein [Candidatus Brocadiales bacterium]|nr:carboxypeptidase-like regulatory domain-containing protein [Candidatus Brocadiales bacterium]
MSSDVIKQAAFVAGKIIHQGTGKPIVGKIRITAKEGPVVCKILEDGTFVLSGDLRLLFPKLADQAYQLSLRIRAESEQFSKGFIEEQLPVMIPRYSNFDPDSNVASDPPIYAGTIRLSADTVNIRGRVVKAKDPDTGIQNATVKVLHSGGTTPSAQTDAKGRYRIDNIPNFQAPAEIECSATGLETEKRKLLIDFGKLVNEENFRLAPP